jgi:hypothetical protein
MLCHRVWIFSRTDVRLYSATGPRYYLMLPSVDSKLASYFPVDYYYYYYSACYCCCCGGATWHDAIVCCGMTMMTNDLAGTANDVLVGVTTTHAMSVHDVRVVLAAGYRIVVGLTSIVLVSCYSNSSVTMRRYFLSKYYCFASSEHRF